MIFLTEGKVKGTLFLIVIVLILGFWVFNSSVMVRMLQSDVLCLREELKEH